MEKPLGRKPRGFSAFCTSEIRSVTAACCALCGHCDFAPRLQLSAKLKL